ncbi:glycyl-tRNA synthetase, beta subunit [Thiobacillus denitrificans ATCC 25259]|uniref:Glycine--tRNA ligase beta subunit n=1 Tax=Thiobacillus denitrificans (strain ATCC 25259 / T1) TaxID=292415 RepID=SYGB_THIDA|nr:glycine--tRNA ligase subunit beta [Thiobacillus denitrificans]Q3SGF0.1 RecName: Full=Glycine--tRNA ligase beta subunit; AltName: Full=Glycyl-tRNA synthetase beta subunit; Short=GlyRS [Thiobacillus denitrificans ATCC 25259]AAZ98300.1 glycyl-tRNA synthetase, beta subunit [Thiobacillus denitrificans ATCC 25259]
MTTANLLVELFVEELPPKALKKLGEAFAAALTESLVAQGLVHAQAAVTHFASPRRLGAHIENVLERSADKPVSTKLMPVSVGLDADGNATPALLKRLAALGADASAVATLRRESDGKAEALFMDSVAKGISLGLGLAKALWESLDKLPIPKVMSYQLADGWSTVNFVRPVHGLVALHGTDPVDVRMFGLTAGRKTHGHRFEAAADPIVLKDADSYAQQLESEGAVIANFAERRAEIVRQLEAAAAPLGLVPVEDEALLDEVTALVERPNVLLGQFEQAFLEVPQECLILTMKANQKYFPLLDAAGKLTNKFLIVSNISPADASAVVGGNERVVRPRLADAKFFFDQDRKKTLDARVLGLAKVVYHNKLGTQGERVTRVQAVARAIGEKLGGEALALKADQAALLAKADLLTDMVGEFPELQGVMGRYYAQHDGVADDVAFAIEDHYRPRFAGDDLPRNPVGVCVALADKLETLVGLFGIGEKPTGDKDPFALRRHALGVVRMLIEKHLPIGLNELVSIAFSAFQQGLLGQAHTDVYLFMFERLSGAMREQGYSANEVDAVLSLNPIRIDLVPQQLEAVRAFAALPEAAALAAANKRVGNILKKAEGEVGASADPGRFVEAAERALFAALDEVAPRAAAAFGSGDYTASLQALAALKAPVDAFFDQVMVNADDPALRANRLALLNQLHRTMNRVADISRLAA